jgi:lipopolysaccharide/colanic/teichoic acid biosynthesis glycosyltransferase
MERELWELKTEGANPPRGAADPSIHPPGVFQMILRHERRRADRDGSTFALAVFAVSPVKLNGKVKGIAAKVKEKTRSIDVIGWLDWEKLGVLLPATDLEGGRIFSRRVMETIAESASVPWVVYVYPSFPPSDERTGGAAPSREPKSEGSGNREQSSADFMGEIVSREVPAWKRFIDLFGSAVLIAAFSPVFLLVGVYIKVVSPGKIFFKQERVGYRGRLFTFLKFRTMHQNNDQIAHRKHLKELIRSGKPMEKLDEGKDPRIIPGGRILRKASLDELPQLFNVLRGEMSLVGPRPCIPYEAEEYRRWHTHRFDVLPGMTGLWQVSGKNRLSFEQMIRLDITYTNRMSFLMDLKILLLTLPTVVGLVFTAGLGKLEKKLDGPNEAFGKGKRGPLHA